MNLPFEIELNLDDLIQKKSRTKLIDKGNCQAIFSHYMHLKLTDYEDKYRQGAMDYFKDVINEKYPDKKITNDIQQDALQYLLLNNERDVPFPPVENPKFTFIDLFAGVGGFRVAMQSLGGKCVFTSEWDEFSKQTYRANFGEVPFGDITQQEVKRYIPDDFDLLCAGFPCQAFSIAGKRGGFEDTRGTLFFDVAQIIKKHKPKAIFLENVKGLISHDKGKTLKTILAVLRDDLGYFVPDPVVINAKDFGVPQNRERIFIVGFRKDQEINTFQYPQPLDKEPVLSDILEETEVSVKYYMSTQYLDTLRKHKQRHAEKGNGFGYQIIDNKGVSNAIVCGGMGRERNLVIDKRLTNFVPITKIKGEVNREGIRRLTPREWARLQGYDDKFQIVVADAQAYKQFGNSVAVPAIKAVGEKIIQQLLG